MYAFVALGLPDGMLGTAWPSVRRSFHVPLEDLGVVLVAGTVGAVALSSVVGLVIARIGIARTVMLGGAVAALGALGLIASPAFWTFVLAGTAIGVAAALIDSSINSAIALAGRNRLLNLVHGSYGIGTTVGPLVVTAAVLAEVPPAAPLAAAPLASAAAPAALAPAAEGPGAPSSATRLTRVRLVTVVALGLIVFMVYTGFEASAGQWAASFDRGPLHLGAGAAGWQCRSEELRRCPWCAGGAQSPFWEPPSFGGGPPRWLPYLGSSSSEARSLGCSRPWLH